ncbi:hypothetical protein REPUB_Repub03eG0000100 [Reevesia pubescens]
MRVLSLISNLACRKLQENDASEDFLQAAAAGSSWFSLSASLLFVIASCFLVMLSMDARDPRNFNH